MSCLYFIVKSSSKNMDSKNYIGIPLRSTNFICKDVIFSAYIPNPCIHRKQNVLNSPQITNIQVRDVFNLSIIFNSINTLSLTAFFHTVT